MKKKRAILVIGAALMLLTMLVYLPVTQHKFVAIDDPEYITDNSRVKAGLTLGGIGWALQTGHASNWHPVTWLSHMVDCQIFGLAAGGHHLVNVVFHAGNSLLLFLLLRRMTGGVWTSAFVAALFAWHPLHVESVAWASERKDVLSTCFFLLTLWAYFNYTLQREGRRPYFVALVLFALGLMSKPMLVTLPCVLLLLDYWPLHRFGVVPLKRLVFEKLPFFVLALIDGLVTCLVQRGAATSLEALPFSTRLANAVVSYTRYLGDTFWPARLAVIYPYSKSITAGWVIGAAVVLIALTALFLLRAKRQPYLIVGWFWFLGTLAPTIGLIQVGSQSMADRYMYIPSIGLFVIIVWSAAAWFSSVPYRIKVPLSGGLTGAALVSCLVCTRTQLGSWADSGTLFGHAIKVTKDNYIAWDGLGTHLDGQGKHGEAIRCYLEAVRLKPGYAQGQYDLGTALLADGKTDEAMARFSEAVKLEPRFARAHINLGKALLGQGKVMEAAQHLSQAAALTPDDAEAQYNLGTVLLMQSRPEEAFGYFAEALRLKPDYREAHSNLGILLMGRGQIRDGVAHFSEALRLDPANPEAHYNLGLALLQADQPAEATAQFAAALELKPDSAKIHYQLAVAFARQGNPAQAEEHARKALDLARGAGQQDLAAQAEALLHPVPAVVP